MFRVVLFGCVGSKRQDRHSCCSAFLGRPCSAADARLAGRQLALQTSRALFVCSWGVCVAAAAQQVLPQRVARLWWPERQLLGWVRMHPIGVAARLLRSHRSSQQHSWIRSSDQLQQVAPGRTGVVQAMRGAAAGLHFLLHAGAALGAGTRSGGSSSGALRCERGLPVLMQAQRCVGRQKCMAGLGVLCLAAG